MVVNVSKSRPDNASSGSNRSLELAIELASGYTHVIQQLMERNDATVLAGSGNEIKAAVSRKKERLQLLCERVVCVWCVGVCVLCGAAAVVTVIIVTQTHQLLCRWLLVVSSMLVFYPPELFRCFFFH